jgi:hypothetical protein
MYANQEEDTTGPSPRDLPTLPKELIDELAIRADLQVAYGALRESHGRTLRGVELSNSAKYIRMGAVRYLYVGIVFVYRFLEYRAVRSSVCREKLREDVATAEFSSSSRTR